MYNYLIADYILGYSLSSDGFFSATDIANELSLPSGPIAKIFTEICTLKVHWFEMIDESAESERKIQRRKEFDEEIIQWLINGGSKEYYGDSETTDSPYQALKQLPRKKSSVSVKSV